MSAAPSRSPITVPTLLSVLLSDAAIELVQETGHDLAVERDDVVQEAGHRFEHVYVFHSGCFAQSIGGVVTNLYGPGDTFLSTLDLQAVRSPGRLRALTRGAAAAVPVATLRKIALRDPSLSLYLANQALAAVMRAQIFHARARRDPLEVRLAYVLWSLSEPLADGRRRVASGLPHAELASYLGVRGDEIGRTWELLAKTGYLCDADGEFRLDSSTPLLLESAGYELASEAWSQGLLEPVRAV